MVNMTNDTELEEMVEAEMDLALRMVNCLEFESTEWLLMAIDSGTLMTQVEANLLDFTEGFMTAVREADALLSLSGNWEEWGDTMRAVLDF